MYNNKTTDCTAPARPDKLEEAIGEDKNPSEHFLFVQLHELVVVCVGAHVDDPVHVQVQVVDRLRMLIGGGRSGKKQEQKRKRTRC